LFGGTGGSIERDMSICGSGGKVVKWQGGNVTEGVLVGVERVAVVGWQWDESMQNWMAVRMVVV
jgi:hypothetical protein